MGHRIAKHVGTTNTANTNPATNFILESSTYYVLDASGNTMSVYERTVNGIAASIKYEQAEKHIYGSSRLGVMNVAVNLLGTAGTAAYSQTNWTHRIGQRTYELANHLGNVLSVISDKVIPHPSGGSVAYYKADILQAMDYSPFGVTLKGRDFKKTGVNDKFRFGFNGMEADDEIKGEGNSYDFGARMLDSSLGRWLCLDPLMAKFPHQSPYCTFDNNPIFYTDPDGRSVEGDYYGKNGKYLGSDGIKDNKAYVADSADASKTGKDQFTNAKELSLSHSDLKNFAATVFHESSGDRTESHAIANAVVNHSNETGKSIPSLTGVENNYSYAAGQNDYDAAADDKHAMEGVINAITGGHDHSHGATLWDGRDVLVDPNHFRYRKASFDDRIGIYIPTAKQGNVHSVIYNVGMFFATNAYNKNSGVYEDLFKNAFLHQLSYTRYEAGSLYTVTNASGHSIFYKHTALDIKSEAVSGYMRYFNSDFMTLYKYFKTN